MRSKKSSAKNHIAAPHDISEHGMARRVIETGEALLVLQQDLNCYLAHDCAQRHALLQMTCAVSTCSPEISAKWHIRSRMTFTPACACSVGRVSRSDTST